MHSYHAARKSFSALESFAWIIIVLGALAAVGGLSAASSGMAMLLAAMPGVGLAMLGFFGLAYVQTSRATVDTAEYTQQILKASRDQHEISKQLLKLAQPTTAHGYTQPDDAPKSVRFDTQAPVEPVVPRQPLGMSAKTEYGGFIISEKAGSFLVDGREFDTLVDAKSAIDSMRLQEKVGQIEAK